MITLVIVFATAVLAGLAFWIYNRNRMATLQSNIADKNAIIGALQNHVEVVEAQPQPQPKQNQKTEQRKQSKPAQTSGGTKNTQTQTTQKTGKPGKSGNYYKKSKPKAKP